MNLGTLFVKRPVMTSMVFFGLVVFGVLSWLQLPRELFPNISVPQLVIITKYPNAAPEEIENLITKPIEEGVGTVPNLKRVKSVSKEGISAVTLEFRWGTDMGFAHLAAREKLDRMKDRLPQEAEEPIIKRVNPFSQPVMIVSITGRLDLPVMTKLCEDIVKKKLEKTEGVGSVTISGGQKREILVEVDRGRLDASHVSLPMVVEAIKNANYDYPAGTTQGKVVEYLVRTHGRFTRMDEIGKTIVQVENPEVDPVYKWKRREDKDHGAAPNEQRLISLDSLAEIKESLEDKTSYSRYNGNENISIAIQKQAEANTVSVSKAVRAAMGELKQSLPSDFNMAVIYDESTYITDALSNMRDNIIIGGLLAFVVLFVFLGDLRDALFAGLAIPIAILLTVVTMYICGFSMNMLTLAGLALSVGSMSDCSICMTDNITRHHKILKKPLIDAAIDGTNEMIGAMLSSTLTNIAVFLPLLFVSGIAQQLFQGLFMVTIFTNFASLFVSITFIPRMAAYPWDLSFVTKRYPWLSKIVLTEDKQQKINSRYRRWLSYALDHPAEVVLGTGLALALSIFTLVVLVPKVFMPKMDQGQFMVQLNMPIGTRLEVTNDVARKLEGVLSNFKNINMAVIVGSAQEEEEIEALQSHQARIAVTVDTAKGVTTTEVIEKFKSRVKMENIEGGQVTYLLQDSPLRSALAGGAPIEVEVKGNDLTRLKYISDELVKKFEDSPSMYGVQTTFALPSKETKVIVDKDRASAYQLSVADIARTALIAIKGMITTQFKEGGDDINIRVRLRKVDRESNENIRQLALRSPQRGMMVSLNDVAQILPGTGASEIRHLDQQRSFVVTAEVAGSTSKAIDEVRKILRDYRAFKDVTIDLGGESRRVAESFSSLKYTFILAIFLIYMIMAAQFESVMQPLIIMSTVPLSVVGVALTLYAANMPLSSVAALGVVILAGIVVNNGIVLIDYINSLVADGMEVREAIISGSLGRIRPILMTMFTAVLGSAPLAIGIGQGDELAQPLAVVTFGGLFVSTFLTLFIIPFLYYQLSKWQAARPQVQKAVA